MRVESAAISDMRDEDERRTQFVCFEGDDEYVDVGVPGELHRGFIEADSRGPFFAREIRDRFPCSRVDS